MIIDNIINSNAARSPENERVSGYTHPRLRFVKDGLMLSVKFDPPQYTLEGFLRLEWVEGDNWDDAPEFIITAQECAGILGVIRGYSEEYTIEREGTFCFKHVLKPLGDLFPTHYNVSLRDKGRNYIVKLTEVETTCLSCAIEGAIPAMAFGIGVR